jgi:hypothetical protein
LRRWSRIKISKIKFQISKIRKLLCLEVAPEDVPKNVVDGFGKFGNAFPDEIDYILAVFGDLLLIGVLVAVGHKDNGRGSNV